MFSLSTPQFQPMNDYFGLATLVSRVGSEGTTTRPSRSRSISDSSNSVTMELEINRLWFDFETNGIDTEYTEEDSCLLGFQPFNITNFDNLDKRKSSGAKKNRRMVPEYCVFCKNNGEMESVYHSHVLKNSEGRVRCPILRKYTCPICGINGDYAHTIKYCPSNTLNQEDERLPLRTPRTSTGCRKGLRPL